MDKNMGRSLNRIVGTSDSIKQVLKQNLEYGDCVYVKTHNSMYKILKKEENLFEVTGGWFDKKGISPALLPIRGCTWGGSVIKIGIVAACGLCLEFGNNLITSPIVKIVVLKAHTYN